jgi:NADH-quinone oxidoreductase subunit N
MNLILLLPELLAIAAALGVMLWDLWLPKERKSVLATASMVGCVVLFASTFVPDVVAGGTALNGSFVVDGMALLMKRIFAITAFLVFLMSREYVADLPRGHGEYYTLGLLALVGMFFCSSVNDFMSLFVSLEVVTVSFFVLVAFKRDSTKSIEAGLKLLIIGSISAAMLLYGIAFVYGATGTVFFEDLRQSAVTGELLVSTELLIGLFLIFLGLGFKTSAVPLHVWVPDVYQGAPTPVTAYLSVGSKLAGFVLMLRMLEVFGGSNMIVAELTPFLALIAALTLFYGNLGAIPQTNIKRLMGYSSIGQCGYILLGVAAAWEAGLSAALFYMAAYVFANLGVFAVIVYVSRATKSHEIEDYSGLARRNPLLGAVMTIGLLSLAGVPPLVGVVGKVFLLSSAFARPELMWLVIVGLINVVVGLYYYLCVIKRMWIKDARSPAEPVVPQRVKVALAVCTIVVLATGFAPQLIESMTAPAAAELGLPKIPR